VWFRGYDLRVHDNAPLMNAVEQARKAPETTSVYPLFVFDRRAFSPTEWSSPKTDGYRARFLVESVNDLKLRLRSIDSDLLVSVRLPTSSPYEDTWLCQKGGAELCDVLWSSFHCSMAFRKR
jgi:deoxyribodipyrimidine photo-lyase